jgi:eukaryotic-like serine/threonine-protein kinase
MPGYYEKLAANYSPELIDMVRWCLELDPLARPQSLFALQKELSQPRKAPEPPPVEKAASGWRGLADRFGLGRKKTAD